VLDVFIKICGITNLEDARAAVERGATAVGFVFWPGSPRFVEPGEAREIVAGLPPSVATVGVFVNQSAEYVDEVAGRVGLRAVQLHGDESQAFAAAMSRPVIKAVNFGGASDLRGWKEDITLLVDAPDPVRRGGTGTKADWDAAAGLARMRRVILAGGLTPENVAEAIARVRPYGIDVSSGVERSPGLKDHGRLAALFEAVERSLAAEKAVLPDQRDPADV
jgi:phosphoribosylanthranilate isomerase